jgi:hypothetical protein
VRECIANIVDFADCLPYVRGQWVDRVHEVHLLEEIHFIKDIVHERAEFFGAREVFKKRKNIL